MENFGNFYFGFKKYLLVPRGMYCHWYFGWMCNAKYKEEYPEVLEAIYKTFMHGIFDIFNNLVFKNYYSHIPIQLSSNTFHTLVHSELKIWKGANSGKPNWHVAITCEWFGSPV